MRASAGWKLVAAALVASAVGGCRSAEPEVRRDLPFEVTTSVDEASASSQHRLAQEVWGLEPSDLVPAVDPGLLAERGGPQVASQDPEGQDPEEQDPEGDAAAAQDPAADGAAATAQGPTTQERATMRARFGSTVLIAPDGTVTKQYFLTGEAGNVFLNLLFDPTQTAQVDPTKTFGPLILGGGEDTQSILGQMLGDDQVEVFYMPNFEVPEGVQIGPDPAKPEVPAWNGTPPPVVTGAPNNLLLVSAKPDALAAFESALNLFFANIPQIEIEIKVVEYDTSNTLAFGVEQVDDSTATITQLADNKLVNDIISNFPLVAPSFSGTEFMDRGTITLGGIYNSWQLAARLQALEVEGIADILSSPRLVVRNGGIASVVTKTDFPYPQARISSSGQNVTANIKFRPVGVVLNIRPVIAGTETVILQIYANISAVTSFADTEPVDTPVVASRQVTTAVHVSNGKTTVIGGLVTHQTIEQTSQTPILGDIPIIGWLFRSTLTVSQKTTLEFHITPRIIQGAGSYFGG